MISMENLKKREINFWLTLLSPILTLVFTIGVYTTTINNQSEKIKQLEVDINTHKQWGEAEHKSLDKTMLTIQVQLAEIQKDILYIKEKINK